MKKIIIIFATIVFLQGVSLAQTVNGVSSPTVNGVSSPTVNGVAISAGVSEGVVGNAVRGDWGGYFSGGITYDTHTATSSGSVSYCHIKVVDGDGLTFPVAIADNSGTRLAYGSGVASGNTEQWVNIALNTTITITASTNYRLAAGCSASWTAQFIARALVGGSMRTATESYSNPLPATITDDGEVAPNIQNTMICNNTATSPN